MADINFKRILKTTLSTQINQNCYMYGGFFFEKYVYLFMDPLNVMLVFGKELSDFEFQKHFNGSVQYPVEIVGNYNAILLLSSKGNLYKYTQNSDVWSFSINYTYEWKIVEHITFTRVLAITNYQKGFVCLGINKEKKKQLISFEINTLPNYEDYTFSDLNDNDSCDYYLKTVKKCYKSQGLIVFDKISGRIYLCSDNGQYSMIYCSQFRLISAISIVSEDCLLLCFENGKLFFHFFSQICPGNTLFLTSKVFCIEKCFCNDRCLLWSDGVNLQHTEINFSEGSLNKKDFEVSNNIIGITSFRKVKNFIIATTINCAFYEIQAVVSKKNEIVQAPSKILSQIYNESLKINNFQTHLQTLSDYINFKEKIENNQLCLKVSSKEYISITNKSEMIFKKEFWEIELREVSKQEYVQVNAVKLETDMAKEMTVRIKNPFKKCDKMKVYLVGQYEMGILSVCIGTFKEEVKTKKIGKYLPNDFNRLSVE